MSAVSAANDVYVNTTGNDTSGTGTADNPYLTIQKGLDNVDPNGVINIADGQYSGINNTNITLDKNMTISGQSQTGTIINGTNTNWIFHIPNDVSVNIMNLTIVNGYRDEGSAIYNMGNLSVTNCNFTNNTANFCAIYNSYGNCTVTDCTFNDNKANINCGAIGSNGGICTVTDCTFSNNKAEIGGAIINGGAIFTVTGCIFTDNNATNLGGAIASQFSILSAHYNRFYNNTATNGGNAIYCQSSSVNATLNWWGSNTDPSTITNLILADPGASVWSDPWLFMTINATPTTINNTQSSLITVSFNNYSSDGTTCTSYTPGAGEYIPDGTLVNFQTDLGTIGCKSIDKFTTGGIATATLTASELAGIAHVNATTDLQTVYVNVLINPKSNVYLNITPDKTNPVVGDTVTYRFKVGNYGPDSAENVVMTFTVPNGLVFAGATDNIGNKWNYDANTRTITWNLGTVPVGDPDLWVSFLYAAAGEYVINPLLSTTTYDPDLNANTQSVTVHAAAAAVNAATITSVASGNTVGMQSTGIPITGIIIAILMVLGGFIGTRKQ